MQEWNLPFFIPKSQQNRWDFTTEWRTFIFSILIAIIAITTAARNYIIETESIRDCNQKKKKHRKCKKKKIISENCHIFKRNCWRWWRQKKIAEILLLFDIHLFITYWNFPIGIRSSSTAISVLVCSIIFMYFSIELCIKFFPMYCRLESAYIFLWINGIVFVVEMRIETNIHTKRKEIATFSRGNQN